MPFVERGRQSSYHLWNLEGVAEARLGWASRWSRAVVTSGQVKALKAVVRETLAREPAWSLNDAIRHAVAFVVP